MIRDRCDTRLMCQGLVSSLVDESAPGLATPVAQDNPEAVGNARDGTSVGVTKCVTHRFLANFVGGPAPNVAELVSQSKMIAVAEAIEAGFGAFFFKIEEAARYLAMDAPAVENAAMNHQVYYQDFCSNCRSGNYLNAIRTLP